jgi:hypothetical protein
LGATISVKAQEMTEKQKNNYAIGAILGEKLQEEIKKADIDSEIIETVKGFIKEKIDITFIIEGVRDTFKGECKISKEEKEAVFAEIMEKIAFFSALINSAQGDDSEEEVEVEVIDED